MSKMSEAHLDEQENPTWGNKVNYANPVFQKRHFEFIAKSFKDYLSKCDKVEGDSERYEDEPPTQVMKYLASTLKQISPKFNEEMFLKKAGIKNDDK